MSAAPAYAKINLSLVVGAPRPDGKHEVVTVLQAVGLHDDVAVEPASEPAVEGFPEDTLVRAALEGLAREANVEPLWRVGIDKRIPVASGLGGGSSDAGTALWLANELLAKPLPFERLQAVASTVGADVPFFLHSGTQLGEGDGSRLSPLELPLDYTVVLALPAEARKESTAAVYRAFDERAGARGFDERSAELRSVLAGVRHAPDLARLPHNDLASSSLAGELHELGAFRADVTGAGPVVYGLFERRADAERAAAAVSGVDRTWVVAPVQGR